MENNDARTDQLRKKRAQVQSASDQDRLRALYGEKLVVAIAEATGKPLSLDNFNSKDESLSIEWPADIRDAVGLVAAYISRSNADRLLACVRDKLIALSGRIGFHEKPYLGFAELHEVDPVSLLAVAETTEESVVFYSDAPAGIVMVDCYKSQPSEPFSVVVQGDELVQQLAPCFQAERPGGGPSRGYKAQARSDAGLVVSRLNMRRCVSSSAGSSSERAVLKSQAIASIVLVSLFASGCSPHSRGQELLVSRHGGNELALIVANGSTKKVSVPRHLVIAGKGGGDVVAVIVSEDGKLAPSCAVIDVFDPQKERVEVVPGTSHEGWHGSLQLLKQWHCLEQGKYSVAFALVLPNNEMVLSEPFAIEVAPTGEARFL